MGPALRHARLLSVPIPAWELGRNYHAKAPENPPALFIMETCILFTYPIKRVELRLDGEDHELRDKVG